jgi:hypothetical protein
MLPLRNGDAAPAPATSLTSSCDGAGVCFERLRLFDLPKLSEPSCFTPYALDDGVAPPAPPLAEWNDAAGLPRSGPSLWGDRPDGCALRPGVASSCALLGVLTVVIDAPKFAGDNMARCLSKGALVMIKLASLLLNAQQGTSCREHAERLTDRKNAVDIRMVWMYGLL